MPYILLGVLGGLLLMVTSGFDFWQSQSGSASSSERPEIPSDVPVGKIPEHRPVPEERIKFDPTLLGYILAVFLELPLLLSVAGVI